MHSEASGSEVLIHAFNNEVENAANEIYNFACWVSKQVRNKP